MAVKTGGKGVPQAYDTRTGKWIKQVGTQRNEKRREPTNLERISDKMVSLGIEKEKIQAFLQWYQGKDTPQKEDEELNYMNKETMDKLKSSDEGRKLVINAPKMENKDLKEALKRILGD